MVELHYELIEKIAEKKQKALKKEIYKDLLPWHPDLFGIGGLQKTKRIGLKQASGVLKFFYNF